jgi:hypothetical protein
MTSLQVRETESIFVRSIFAALYCSVYSPDSVLLAGASIGVWGDVRVLATDVH